MWEMFMYLGIFTIKASHVMQTCTKSRQKQRYALYATKIKEMNEEFSISMSLEIIMGQK